MSTQLMRPCGSEALAAALGLAHEGVPCAVHGVAPLEAAAAGTLSFSTAPTLPAALPAGSAVVAVGQRPPPGVALLRCAQPRLGFVRALAHLRAQVGFAAPARATSVHPSVRQGQHCVIGAGARIGAHTVLGDHVVVRGHVRIGAHCVVGCGSVVGEDGFGFERDADGTPLRMVQLGGVRIGDHVEIGCLTTVCRGTLADTEVDDYAKVDDHVHVAHNVRIGRGAIVVAGAVLCGGTEVGAGAWVAPNAAVRQKVRLGARSVVGLGAVVLRHVADDTTVAGVPARPLGGPR